MVIKLSLISTCTIIHLNYKNTTTNYSLFSRINSEPQTEFQEIIKVKNCPLH